MKTEINPLRRTFSLGVAIGLLPVKFAIASTPTKPVIEIWKSPTCGCCRDWMTHMTNNGYAIGKVHDEGNDIARKKLGIGIQYGSCHTALIGGYAFEGHVPAKDVARVLKEKPNIAGLAVPGMPIGSPGMDGPEYKGKKDSYDVLAIQKNGQAVVYRHYN
jgi:hypothetical protein